ncbi:unnamed protein product [Lactuca saligna]|uniref:Uncharacterized protein n=1 Tax=Lactuca saligna TaxID=75948 RepID=A0AA35ZY11_LACSI|nr:unnamed protein product [Lactuca saligna]
MIQTMDVHEDQDLDGLPNVPSSRYRNSDAHDGNPANWIGKDFDDQDYGEDSEEDYIEETPALNVIPSDESNQEEEPQEQQPSKNENLQPHKTKTTKKTNTNKKPPPPQNEHKKNTQQTKTQKQKKDSKGVKGPD